MLQPFVLLKNYPLQRFIQLGKIYFVTQSYPRADNPLATEQKQNILVSDYDEWIFDAQKFDWLNFADEKCLSEYKPLLELKRFRSH